MDRLFILGFIAVVSFLVFSAVLIEIGKKKKQNDQDGLTLLIVGWILLVLSIAGGIAAFIVYIHINSGIFGTILFAILCPLFIIGGSIGCLASGITSLTHGYRRNKEGRRDKNEIAKGWSMLSLSVLLVVVVIVTITLLLTTQSNVGGDTPVATM